MTFLVLMIIFALISLGLFGYSIYKVVNLIKHPMPATIDYRAEVKRLAYLVLATGISAILLFVFLSLFQKYPLKVLEWFLLIIGSLFFGLGLPTGVLSFMLHYYGKELKPETKKFFFKNFLYGALLVVVGLWLLTNSFADYLIYPMVNGLNFTKGFVNPASGTSPNIAWYAICIISGAILVYFICDHRYFKEYGVHGVLESTFFVAFPAGVIGARIGYVIGEWNHGPNSFAERVANGQWWAPLAIWEGGLTVISGALIGIIVGVAWFIWRNKKYSIWMAVDIIVPTILIAQAVGRWGNFFNCEVHGLQSDMSNWWFLPKIVANNARYSDVAGFANEGYLYVPLFFIESITNLLGYFIIRFAIGKGLRKYIELGDLAFLYIAWYGLTRVIMEPLRDTHYNMGNDGYWSWFWSMVFVVGAVLLIVINHLVRFIIEIKKGTGVTIKKSFEKGMIGMFAFLAASIGFIVAGAVLMSQGTFEGYIAFNSFNNGLIVLIIGVSIFLLQFLCVPYIYRGFVYRWGKHEQEI